MIKRASVTSDAYQESHLATVFNGWARGMYWFLALLTGSMAVAVYINQWQIIAAPLVGWAGYYFFLILTAGTFVISLYSALGAMEKGQIERGRVTFSWWGFWVRDFYMAAVFFPFAIIIGQVIFSGAGEGAFIDLGGWDSLLNSATPWSQRIVLGLMGLIIGGVVLVIGLIPVWLLWRSFINLGVQLKKGTTTALFDAMSYAPGEILTVEIKTAYKEKPRASRRVFINLLQIDARAQPPPSKKKYQRHYLYSEYQDLTVEEQATGVSFVLPTSIPDSQPTSAHQDSDQIRYWEILVEEPQRLYWARFLFEVE